MAKSTEQLIQEVRSLKGLGCPAEQKVLIDLVLALADEKASKPATATESVPDPVKGVKKPSVSAFQKLVGGSKK